MKKILLFASALAGLFLAASCQQENLEPVGGNTVTYTVQVPEALATKAIGDEIGMVNELVYEVYRTKAAKEVAFTDVDNKLYHRTADIDNGIATIKLELVNNQNFTILFWAQVRNNGIYDVDDLTNVTIAQDLDANQLNYAAFSGVDFIENGAIPVAKTVELHRPIAQLNIATTPQSLNAFDNPVVLDQSKVTVKGLSTSFDVAAQSAGETSATALYTYDWALVPNSTLEVAGNPYQYVAMNYVGFAPEAGTNIVAEYWIKTSEGEITNSVNNVPVKPNYRTNLIGNLITSSSDYTIKLDKNWYTPSEDIAVVTVSTAQELQDAINNTESGNIKLDEDIDLGALADMISSKAGEGSADPAHILLIPADRSVVLDLNEKTLKGTALKDGGRAHLILNKGNLTIKNGSLTALGTNGGSAISNNGTLTITDATVNGASSDTATGTASYAVNSQGTESKLVVNNSIINGRGVIGATKGTKVEINGGTYHTPAVAWGHAVYAVGEGTEVVINDGTFSEGYEFSATNWGMYQIYSGDKAKVIVNSGDFSQPWDCANGYDLCTASEGVIEIYGGTFADDPSSQNGINYVAAGYESVYNEETKTYSVVRVPAVAQIGEITYRTLSAAIEAVEDGGTITMIADEVFTENNRKNNGGSWYEGLLYDGDKSFTLDLGGKTLSQNGAVNDYLLYFKNNGEKANTITIKNGTVDAGETAYAAIATSSSNAQKITMNLEKVSINGNNSGGAVVKFRGGGELNVKAGTVITGKDSYVGIEAVGNNTVVNVYEGAEIYQKGTSSYVGAIVGASQNATLNIYGGKGKSAKCGIIVMSTGATINVSGGEWTANNDGTVAGDNSAVLVSQNNRYESGWACKSILNVTGGTFKGGYNCYGGGPGQEPDDAQIHISGGNFNADPTAYVDTDVYGVVNDKDAGVWIITAPETINTIDALKAAVANAKEGEKLILGNNLELSETLIIPEGKKIILDLNGKTITAPTSSAFEVKAGGELTVKKGKVVAYESTVRAIGGKVVVESGEYTSTGTAVDSPSTYRYSLDSREGGELTINGGTFKSNNGMINVGSTVTINGGKFENIVEKTMTRHFAYVSALLTINDGEFYGKANSSAGGCFFCGAAETGDIQVNGGKFTSLWTSGSVNKIFESYYGGTITVTGGMFNTNGGIATFVTENTDEATKAAYPYVAK